MLPNRESVPLPRGARRGTGPTVLRGGTRLLVAALLLAAAPLARADAQRDFEDGAAAHDRGDVIVAIELLKRAAAEGHVPAMVRLGYVLDQAEENEAAIAYYTRAAQAGSAEAALALGVMVANGEGVARDNAQALAWMTRAADAGHGPAFVTLAYVHLRGDLGVPPSREQALHWLEKGIAVGYAPARIEKDRILAAGSDKAKKR